MAKMVKTKSSTKGDTDLGSTKTKVLKMKPKAEVAAEAPAEKKKAKTPPVRKFVGKASGLGINAFQNQLMKSNYKVKLTDEQLAAAMRKEFPSAVAYTVGHVRGIRSAWNKGKHGNEIPAKPLAEFDEAGEVVAARKRVPPKKAKVGVGVKVEGKVVKKKAPPVEEEEEEDESEEDDTEEADEEEESEDEDEE